MRCRACCHAQDLSFFTRHRQRVSQNLHANVWKVAAARAVEEECGLSAAPPHWRAGVHLEHSVRLGHLELVLVHLVCLARLVHISALSALCALSTLSTLSTLGTLDTLCTLGTPNTLHTPESHHKWGCVIPPRRFDMNWRGPCWQDRGFSWKNGEKKKTRMLLSRLVESRRVTGTSIPVLSLYYKAMKFQPSRGNVDSSTKFVLVS